MKTCKQCNIVKDEFQFQVNRNNKDNLFSKCKSCIREYHRQYVASNRDKVNAYNRRYRALQKAKKEARAIAAQNPINDPPIGNTGPADVIDPHTD